MWWSLTLLFNSEDTFSTVESVAEGLSSTPSGSCFISFNVRRTAAAEAVAAVTSLSPRWVLWRNFNGKRRPAATAGSIGEWLPSSPLLDPG